MSSTDEEFSKFVKFCEQNLTGCNKPLVSLIKKRYNDCNEKFKNSRELRHLLSSSRKKMAADSKHLFVHLKDCLNELKAYSSGKVEKRKREKEYDSDDHMWKKTKLSNGNTLESEETDSSVKSRSLTSSPVVIEEEESDKEVKPEQTLKTQDQQWRDKLKISPDVASRKLHTANLATIIKNLKEKKTAGGCESGSSEDKASISCLDKTGSTDHLEDKSASITSGDCDVMKSDPCHVGDSTVDETTSDSPECSGSGKLASSSTTDSGPDKTTSSSPVVKPDTSDCKKNEDGDDDDDDDNDDDDDCIVIDDSPPCDDEDTTSNVSSKSKAATTNKLSLTKSGSTKAAQSRPDLSPEVDTMAKVKIEASDADTAMTNTVSDSLPSKCDEVAKADPVMENLPVTDSKQCFSSNNDTITTPDMCSDDTKLKISNEDLEKGDISSKTMNKQNVTDVDLEGGCKEEVIDADLEGDCKEIIIDADLEGDCKEVCNKSSEPKNENTEQTAVLDSAEHPPPRPDVSSDEDANKSPSFSDIPTLSSPIVTSVCSIAVESDSEHGECSTLISDLKEDVSEPGCSTDVPRDITAATKCQGSPRSPRSPARASHSDDKKEKKKKEVSAKHIHRLEKLLEKLRDKIDRLQEKELTLDDLDQDDSYYVFEDKLKKKFVAVWNKLCELKERTPTTGRPTERRFTYQGTRYPEVNKKIEKMINKKKMFPDFHDIRRLVAKVNISHKLHLSNPAVDSLAREAFTDVGNMLQHRRREDFITTFGCKITDTVDVRQDPAIYDPELQRKLDDNKTQGKAKLEEVIRKYSDMQHARGDVPEEVPEGSDVDKSDAEKSEEDLEVVAVTIEDLDSDNEDIVLVESSPSKNMIQRRWSRSPSPHARMPSPQLRTPSPRPRTPSPQARTPSPQLRTPSPRPRTPSPGPRTSSPQLRTPSSPPRTPSPQPRTPSPQPRIPSPQPRTPSPEIIIPSPQPRSPSPQPASSPVVVSPCMASPGTAEGTVDSPKTIQPRSPSKAPCSSPLASKKCSSPDPESPQTIQPRYAARQSPSSPIEIDDSVVVSDSDDEDLSPIKTDDYSFAPSLFAESSFDCNPTTSTVKKKTLIPASFGEKPFGSSFVNNKGISLSSSAKANSASAGTGRNYIWSNSSSSSNGVKRLSLNKNSSTMSSARPVSSTSSLSIASPVKMAATVKPFSIHKQPSSPLNRSRDHIPQQHSPSFRHNTNHSRLSNYKTPSSSPVKQTITNRLSYPQTAQNVSRTASGVTRQVLQNPNRASQQSQVMRNRGMPQTVQRQGGVSRQMPQTYNRVSPQMIRTHSGMSQQSARPHSRVSQQIARPHSRVSQQIAQPHSAGSQQSARHHSGISQQMARPRSGMSQQLSHHQSGISRHVGRSQSEVSQQITQSHGRVSQQSVRSHSGVSPQMARPHSGMLQQMSRSHVGGSQQVTQRRSGMSQQLARSHTGVKQQTLQQHHGMPQQSLHKRNGASRDMPQSFREKQMSPLKQAMQMSSQCYIDIDDTTEESWNEGEGELEEEGWGQGEGEVVEEGCYVGKGDMMEEGQDVVVLSDSD